MWVAVIVSIFSYLSIEMIAVAAGEAEDPQRAITQGLSLHCRAPGDLLPADHGDHPGSLFPGPNRARAKVHFVTVMARSHVPLAAGVVNFVILVAALSAMNSQLYITTRMMFSLARAGYAPRRFGDLSARGTPVSALLLSSIGIALATRAECAVSRALLYPHVVDLHVRRACLPG